ncbi:MAG: anaerobic ribonucleoside-triphosphate reductase activating protein [Kiritimatiellae bacterium]|jgi:pyruvate formate lyase activating enzyme|nr:anaerobic ribonucleoside-triphosphate reductase activating protein [Kiritimatiellia bacterium]MDD4341479.1 anaerobic ribonucleoside-triphosphate reductase activating protein [Kiritimatiellia bacterium]MDY0149451.1 anaerobic ribonucleoside-triphosphate reductase activating protein [Kiritimatiellia bacterium]
MTTRSKQSPVFGIMQDASMVDYPGRMAAVMFLPGCNFRCGFCHNAPLMGRVDVPTVSWADVEKICRTFRNNWIESVVVTGGEPTLHPGLPHLMEQLRAWGFTIKLDTNGSRPAVLETLLPQVDYVAMDVKCAPGDYAANVGFADVEAVSRSIALIQEQARQYEFRTTVIEAWHDAEKMRAMGEWVRGAKRHVLQAFVPRDDLPDPAFRGMRETPAEILHQRAEVLRAYVERVEVRGEF